MKLTKGSSRSHKYHLCLTTAEVLAIAHPDLRDWRVFDQLHELLEKEAEKLGQMSSGQSAPME